MSDCAILGNRRILAVLLSAWVSAALLASPAPRPLRRRPRLAAVPNPSDSLFPS